MKERPILYSAPMVRARRDGRKTQTRRVMYPQPSEGFMPTVGRFIPSLIDRDGEMYLGEEIFGAGDEMEGYACPYGEPGDRLWVREAWRTERSYNSYGPSELPKTVPIWYEEDGAHSDLVRPDGNDKKGRYRHARFMCRWMSRGLDEITTVRVERLNDISVEDARSEGPDGRWHPDDSLLWTWRDYRWPDTFRYGEKWGAREGYRTLWESLHGAGSWDLNPWVWVIEFKTL